MQAPAQGQRSYVVLRTALIGYGVVVFSYLFTRSDAFAPRAIGSDASAVSLVAWGVVVQLVLIAARALIERFIVDRELAAQSLTVVELIGDGASVLLFAVSTLGAIFRVVDGF
jgi:hypothetical protein